MANRYAVASGNWSDPSIWDGGTLPQAGDVVRPNGFTITIDQNITVNSLRNDASSPAVANGTFILLDNITINASNLWGFNVNLITYGGLLSSTINSNITIARDTLQATAIASLVINSGTITVNGNIVSDGATGNSGNRGITLNNAVLNVNGSVEGGSNTANYQRTLPGISIQNNAAVCNIVGTISGGPTGALNNPNPGIWVQSSCQLNVTGILIGGPTFFDNQAIRITSGTPSITINGIIQASNFANAIQGNGNILLISSTVVINTNIMAINSFNAPIFQDIGDYTFTYRTQTNAQKSLYTPGVAIGNPATTDVRNGVTYANGALTGTSVMPSASTVSLGVVYDNGTVGTAQNTADLFLNALTASTSPLAVRLSNVVTTDILGAQIAAYSP